MLNPADFATADEYVAAVMAQEDHAAHGDDLTKSTEHAALFDLVPRSESTHVAVSDGAWSDPATWHEGRIPDAGAKVLIPEAISVTYDSTSQASLFTVRVDGQVDFATDKNTMMKVDTFVVSTTGKLNIGTEANPVQQGVSAQIIIADNGPIDVTWDPMLLSRGVISHGEVQIHGQEKSSHLKVSTDAMQGDTQLVLEAAPEGWQVGDQLVLTGTHYVPWQWNGSEMVYQGTQDEEVVITAIDGNVITLDRPLTYDHDTPRDDLKAHVANYSRNVVIATENADDVPVHQRGHTMFMHSDNVDVRYAEFHELGRTDKSERAVDADAVVDVQSDTNVKGRYAFHLHKTGVDGDQDPSIVTGNAVWGSPGWGFTHHQSNALLENNAAYNTFGAGFVAETGDEIGAWRHNIAIKAEGVLFYHNTKDQADVDAFDLARTGEGFWFQGRMVEAEGNVAAGVNNGYVYMHRGSPVQADADNVDQPEIFRYKESWWVDRPPIQHFIDNEVLASNEGFKVTKSGPEQGHDVRSVIDGFTAWEVQRGVHVEYTSHYTFTDIDLVGTESGGASVGIQFGTSTFDMVVNRGTVAGFDYGASLTKENTFGWGIDEYGYALIDFQTSDIAIAAVEDYDPSVDLLLTSADLTPGRLDFDWGAMPEWSWNNDLLIDGTKTDSIGAVSHTLAVETHRFGPTEMEGLLASEGYYTTPDGQNIVIIEEYFADRATGELQKTGIPVRLASDVPQWFLDQGIHRGTINLSSAAPVTANDTATTQIGTSVVIDVLANDSDAEGDALILDGLVQPRHGKVEANADGTVTYTPDRNFAGEESFNYWVTDDNGSFTRGSVQVSVVAGTSVEEPVDDGTQQEPVDDGTQEEPVDDGTQQEPVDDGTQEEPVDDGTQQEPVDDGSSDDTLPPPPEPAVNEAPVAVGNSYATDARTKITVSAANGVLHNDTDADGDILIARVVDGPAGGKLTFNNNDGSFEYNPRGNFSGTDTFTYRASDGQAESDLATVTITVAASTDSKGGGPKKTQTTTSDSQMLATSDTEMTTTSESTSEPVNTFSTVETHDTAETGSDGTVSLSGEGTTATATGRPSTAAAASEWQDVMAEQILGGASPDFDWLSWRGLEGPEDSAVSQLLEMVESLEGDLGTDADALMVDALQPSAQDFTLV